VRPEKIAISKTKPAARETPNVLRGKVHDIAYSGNLSTYHVQLEDGAILKAQEANRRRIANREITWEDEVWLAWAPGAGVLLGA
jgi:putrescine transport system ATP-binding protein